MNYDIQFKKISTSSYNETRREKIVDRIEEIRADYLTSHDVNARFARADEFFDAGDQLAGLDKDKVNAHPSLVSRAAQNMFKIVRNNFSRPA